MSRAGNPTEAPTPRRLREARREGQVARSPELGAALVLTGAAGLLASLLPAAVKQVLGHARAVWSAPSAEPEAALELALSTAARAALPLLIALAVLGVLAHVIQTGPLLAPSALRPDLSRMNPVEGLRRMFTFQRLGVVLRGCLALALVALVLRALTGSQGAQVLALPMAEDPSAVAAVLAHLLPRLLGAGGALLVGVGTLDLLLARRRLTRELRMTRQEVKDEHRQQEGDPAHKGRRRQAHREVLSAPQRPLREAAVLVVNPTRIAVAVHFTDEMAAPEAGLRGLGETAARLRAEARRLGLPVVRDIALARALLAVDPGQPVPEALYEAVAAVLAAIHRARSLPPGANPSLRSAP